jgi:hypothetical protein
MMLPDYGVWRRQGEDSAAIVARNLVLATVHVQWLSLSHSHGRCRLSVKEIGNAGEQNAISFVRDGLFGQRKSPNQRGCYRRERGVGQGWNLLAAASFASGQARSLQLIRRPAAGFRWGQQTLTARRAHSLQRYRRRAMKAGTVIPLLHLH